MNPEPEKYACEYPQRDGPCGRPAFDWIELNALSPPVRICVCAAHWQEYRCAQQTLYSLPLHSAPSHDLPSDSRAESLNQSPENASGPQAASELLRDFAEWHLWQEACRKIVRGW